jgi:DNA-binding MarR family transcriptional regulator
MGPRWTLAPAGHWKQKLSKPDNKTALFFSFFNEIGIIGQLSGRMLEAGLPPGFLVSHFAVLNHLSRRGDGATPFALAQAFQVPKTTMTHTLSGLEKAKLIRFVPHPDDGRSKCVMLTAKGRQFRDLAIEKLKPEIALMSERFPAGDIAKALDLLVKMREYLDQRRDE